MPTTGLPASLLELLELQAGAVSARQLAELGLRRSAAEDRVASGRWQRVHRGVYVAFSGPMPRLTQIWAGVLRAGPDSATSHETAAELDGLCDVRDLRVHVTAPVTRRVLGADESLVIHYAHRLSTSRHPSKSPPRTRIEDTVLDLVDACDNGRDVDGWVTAACQRRLTTPDRLAASLAARKKIRWRAMAEAMVVDVAEGAQSPLELTYLRRVERAHGLPQGARQSRWAGRRVIWTDVDYDAYRTRVELDGRNGHVGEGVFRDRRRDNRAAVGRTWSLRYGFAETFGAACEVALEVAIVLRDRGWPDTPTACDDGCPLARGVPERDVWAAS